MLCIDSSAVLIRIQSISVQCSSCCCKLNSTACLFSDTGDASSGENLMSSRSICPEVLKPRACSICNTKGSFNGRQRTT